MERKLYLSRTDKKVWGVCGGLAEFFGVDSTLIRVIWAILAFVYGVGFFAYLVAALVIPKRPY